LWCILVIRTLGIPWLPRLVLRSRGVGNVANRSCCVAATDDAEDDGGDCVPASLVLWDVIGSQAFGSAVSSESATEALVAAQCSSAGSERVWTELICLETAWERLVPCS